MDKDEEFMEVRRHMEHAIKRFYESCGAIGIDNEEFAEDVNEAVGEATNQEVQFDDYFE